MNEQKPLKTKVSITLDSDVVDTVHALAYKDDRSFSQFINLALKHHIAQLLDHRTEPHLIKHTKR